MVHISGQSPRTYNQSYSKYCLFQCRATREFLVYRVWRAEMFLQSRQEYQLPIFRNIRHFHKLLYALTPDKNYSDPSGAK